MDELRQIAGLNKYEEMVYLSLIRIGLSTSYGVSNASKVPYGRIYSILSTLETKGFIKVYQGNPKKYIAIEPRVVFHSLVEKKARKFDEEKKALGKLIEKIEATRKIKPTEPREGVNVIEGKRNYLNLSVKLHEKAKREWRAINRFPIYQPHLEAYKKMVKSGVRTRIIAPLKMKDSKEHEIWKETGAEIRFSSKIISGYTIIDDTDVVLRVKDLVAGSYTAIWIQSPALARTLINQFERLWNSKDNKNR